MRIAVDGARFDAIRALVLAVDSGSLTHAAKRLGVTPSAVSRQISRLEDALSAKLLERTTRKLRATAAGLALVERARPLVEGLDETASTLTDLECSVRGRVRISASRAFGRLCLLPAIARLAAAHSSLEFDLVLDARRLDFVEDGIDLAVREGELPDSSLTVRRLGAAAVRLFAAPAWLETQRTPRSLDDLAGMDLLSVPAATPGTDLARLRGRSGKPLGLRPRITVNDLVALADLAAQGCGIAVLPFYVARPLLVAGSLVPVLPRVTIASVPHHLVYPGRRHLPERVAVVLEALAKELPPLLRAARDS
jgi:DNA-binding transcriptional LysR family regulator